MIPCEVVNANNTGKPCPNPGTETAELVYPSGVSETKRCCPEHAAMVQKASAAARSILAARAEARRAESDARAERLAALRTARAIRPVAESPPADPVPPVTPVTEIPTMPDPTSTTTPPKAARGKPAPKPERSSLGGALACRACGKSAGYPLCKADRERVRKLRLLKLLPADFDAKTSPISILDEAWAAFEARKAKPAEPDEDWSRADALLDAAIVNGETSDPEAPAIVPPKVGDRWGDLSPAQRALVPDGSLLYFAEDRETCEKEHGSWPYEAMHDDNVVVRLGPAASVEPAQTAAQPTADVERGSEPDRSGWPVLVRDACGNRTLWWDDGTEAIDIVNGRIYGWEPGAHSDRCGPFDSYDEAADAIRARLPDEVPERKETPPPDPRDAEIARLRAALEGQTLANATLPERVVAAERERDEAVRSIAALRADADELRALREALVSGKGHGIGAASLDALNFAEGRMLDAVRERTRAHDDRIVGVLKYATERILDAIATASDEGRPADRSLIEAVRAIAIGKVPEVSDAR